jgi:hypothetical protein
MKKQMTTKLKLDKQTVRHLSRSELNLAAGGISSESNFNTCRGSCGSSIVYGCTATSGEE